MTVERRSSVRVRSLVPSHFRKIVGDEIPQLEARILDAAVLEAEGVMSDKADWSERADELSREAMFLLNEIRALRQQIAEIQRLAESQGGIVFDSRWLVINDNGLFITSEDLSDWTVGDICEVRLRIPSLQTPDILAMGIVVRVGGGEDGNGFAIVFQHISEAHSKAIIRYALRRERQGARSLRFK